MTTNNENRKKPQRPSELSLLRQSISLGATIAAFGSFIAAMLSANMFSLWAGLFFILRSISNMAIKFGREETNWGVCLGGISLMISGILLQFDVPTWLTSNTKHFGYSLIFVACIVQFFQFGKQN